jgi:hypothetical protein
MFVASLQVLVIHFCAAAPLRRCAAVPRLSTFLSFVLPSASISKPADRSRRRSCAQRESFLGRAIR